MLLFLDGQAHYDTPRIGMKYSAVSGSVWSVVSEGRFGNAIKRVGNGGYLDIAPLTTRLGPWSPTTSGVCGLAVKVTDLTQLGANNFLPSTLFRVTEGDFWHLRVHINQNGTFSLIRHYPSEGPSGPLILVQSIEGLTSNTWMFVEFKWVIHATAGMAEVRVNGIPVITWAGNTRGDDPFYNDLGVWNGMRVLNFDFASGSLTVRVCDLYLADLASAAADDVSDFLGDGVIETILPNNPGASTGWTPSSFPNWAQVDDRPAPDDDGSYVAAITPGTQDTYHFEDIPATSIVKGVHLNILARKEEPGSVTLAPVVHQGGTDYLGPVQGVASQDYDRYITQPYDLNPATLAKFTPAEINAGQFGVKKVL